MKIFKSLQKYEKKTALIDEKSNTVTYKNIFDYCESKLKKIESGKLIFMLADNSKQFIKTYICFLEKKLIQALIDPQININLLNKLIETYSPSYLFVKNKFKIPKNYEIFLELEGYSILRKKSDFKILTHKNLRLLLTTSGSTGSNKFVRISDENIFSNTRSIIRYLNINSTHRSLTTMPPFYTYGLSILNTHIIRGASILVTDRRVIEKKFWEFFNDFKITSFGGVPFFYEVLFRLNFNKMNLKYLKYFTVAGGRLKLELVKYFNHYAYQNAKKFIVMYGQVEATSRISYLDFKYHATKIGSIGKAIPGGRLFLNKKKEICYKGKNVSMGYAKSLKDLNGKDSNKGLLQTGDLGYCDTDGFFFISGRKSRDIKLQGHRINLDELENIIKNFINVNCICLSNNNKILIFLTKKNKKINDLLSKISNITNLHIKNFEIRYISRIPRTSNGKISYDRMRELL